MFAVVMVVLIFAAIIVLVLSFVLPIIVVILGRCGDGKRSGQGHEQDSSQNCAHK
jgi:hypothetical protein